jgi:hypothetical protein
VLTDDNPGGTNPQGDASAGSVEQSNSTSGYDSFLGPVFDTPEETETEPESSVSEEVTQQVAEPESEQTEEQPKESETEPASNDDFLAKLSPEEQAYYAKRYPTLYNAMGQPNQPADMRQAFIDRVNQDRKWAELQHSSPTEPTQKKDETPAAQQAVDPAKQREQYTASIDEVVTTSIHPQVAASLGKEVLASMGLDMSNPEDPEVKAVLDNAPKLGMTLAKGATDLMVSVLQNPSVFNTVVERVFPGFAQMYERTVYAEEWGNTQAYQDKDGNQPFKDLPAYGTREFKEAMQKAAEEIPNFDQLVFTDKSGKELPLRERAQKYYAMLAKIATGQRVKPAAVKEAIETGKKLANQTEQRRAAGKALGSGQGNKQFTPADDESPLARGARIARERDSSVF